MSGLLNMKQIEILSFLSKQYGVEYEYLLKDNIDSTKYLENIENLCSAINNEFMLSGIDSDYEPNTYGLELEELLNIVNKLRIDL